MQGRRQLGTGSDDGSGGVTRLPGVRRGLCCQGLQAARLADYLALHLGTWPCRLGAVILTARQVASVTARPVAAGHQPGYVLTWPFLR